MKNSGQWRVLADSVFSTSGATLAEVRSWIVEQTNGALSDSEVIDLKIIVSEIVQNIYRHGYLGKDGEAFEVKLCRLDDTLMLIFLDSSADPLKEVKSREDLKDLEIGGRGVAMINALAAGYTYERIDQGAKQTVLFEIKG